MKNKRVWKQPNGKKRELENKKIRSQKLKKWKSNCLLFHSDSHFVAMYASRNQKLFTFQQVKMHRTLQKTSASAWKQSKRKTILVNAITCADNALLKCKQDVFSNSYFYSSSKGFTEWSFSSLISSTISTIAHSLNRVNPKRKKNQKHIG